jgi:hypothetical protein
MFEPGKPYSMKELRAYYRNVSTEVWRGWLRPLLPQLTKMGYQPGQRLLTPRQVELIVQTLGFPVATNPPD